MSWIYIQTEPQLWTTGHYKPDGEFSGDRDFGSQEEAAERCHWLNGGEEEKIEVMLDPLRTADMQRIFDRLVIASADDGK